MVKSDDMENIVDKQVIHRQNALYKRRQQKTNTKKCRMVNVFFSNIDISIILSLMFTDKTNLFLLLEMIMMEFRQTSSFL